MSAQGQEYAEASLTEQELDQINSGEAPNPSDPQSVQRQAWLEMMRLNDRAFELYRQGQFDAAIPTIAEAMAALSRAVPGDHVAKARLLGNMAEAHFRNGDYEHAEPVYRQAIGMYERTLGPDNLEIAKPLANLGGIYRDTGNYQQAEALYQRALAILKKSLPADNDDIAVVEHSYAALYAAKGDYRRAEMMAARALSVLMQHRPADDQVLGDVAENLAGIYLAMQQFDRAEDILLQVRAMRQKALPPLHPMLAKAAGNLAELYRIKRDYARAEALFEEALAISYKALPPAHPDIAAYLNNQASLYRDKGDFERAISLYQRSLAIVEKALPPNHINVARILTEEAVCYWFKEDMAEAARLFEKAAEVAEINVDRVVAAGAEIQKQLYLQIHDPLAYTILSFHLHGAREDPSATRLALTTLLRRKGRSLDAMFGQIGTLRRHMDPDAKALFEKLLTARTQLARHALAGFANKDPNEYRKQYVAFQAEVESLETQVSARSAAFRAQASPVTIERVQQTIPANAALVEFAAYFPANVRTRRWDPLRYAAYILKHEGEPVAVDLGEAGRIDEAIRVFSEALGNPMSVNTGSAGRALDELVMRPIRKFLEPAQMLLLAPDGALNLAPFGALADEQGRYLLERHTVTYLSSGRDLLRVQPPAASRRAPVIFANPAYDLDVRSGSISAAPARSWGELRGTAQEAEMLKRLFNEAQVYTGSQATEGRLKRLTGPTILHVATHGFFELSERKAPANEAASPGGSPARDRSPMLRSGLVLAGSNHGDGGDGEDGILTALEAAGLDLWGTRIVVLSACETGLGEINNGDGVYGLRRALVLAGAESQVMSLWKVDDASTRDLMQGYYTRLKSGMGRAEALRDVQLAMLRRNATRHPFHWAGFISVGDWRGVEMK